MALARQVWTLVKKNFLIAFVRRPWTSPVRAFVLPVVVVLFLVYVRNLSGPPSTFGVGSPTPVRSVVKAMNAASGGRKTVVFVNGGMVGGDVDRVIQRVADPLRQAGKTVTVLAKDDDLLDVCPTAVRGVSPCFAAAVFHSSPKEGPGRLWNYTLRADVGLNLRVDVGKSDNDVELFSIPLQHAIDFAIASLNGTINRSVLPTQVMEYPYTSRTEKQRRDSRRISFMDAVINAFAVPFIVCMLGVIYHLVGVAASERELGMSPLIEAMMPNLKRWQPQAVRLAAYHLAFDVVYAPGWIFVGIILGRALFQRSNLAIMIIFHLLAGLSFVSWSIFGASFFKKAQLSGIVTSTATALLAVLAQVLSRGSTSTVAVLSLLFPPMTYVFFLVDIARFEKRDRPVNLLKSAPGGLWAVPGLILWFFLLLQIVVYAALGALIERSLYATALKGRKFSLQHDDAAPVRIRAFSKEYRPSWWSRRIGRLFIKPSDTVTAVKDLSLDVLKGQILVLLGANGSGKTTTLEAVAGLNDITRGSIDVDGTGGLGLCPQKNVMWPDLTVAEHISIFNHLKATGVTDTADQTRQLVAACDLEGKLKARSKTLSGGQKRKLQLAMMFTGGSHVCCVDEVSSGLDPLSRRKIWDILLRERGARTIVLTTHFLDEADLLADYIAILSKGTLKAEGSAVKLKHQLGGGYRVHVNHRHGASPISDVDPDASSQLFHDHTVLGVATSAEAARLVDSLERQGVNDYHVSGPTIESVFLKLAEEMNDPDDTNTVVGDGQLGRESSSIQLLPGRRIGIPQQTWVLFRKRMTILRRNKLPYLAAVLIPVVAAGLVTLLLRGFNRPGCAPRDNVSAAGVRSVAGELSSGRYLNFTVGPSSRLSGNTLSIFDGFLPSSDTASSSLSSIIQSIHTVDSLSDFNSDINARFANVTPGGVFAAADSTEAPTFAYRANFGMQYAIYTQNVFNRFLTNISISTQYADFDLILPDSLGNSFQAIVYLGLAMASYPAFFALYPANERLRNVRALHYSNGVRSLPLWLAYLMFDFCFVLVISVVAIATLAAVASPIFFNIGYLFVVFVLYGIASTTFAYIISLMAKSQLAAFAFCATGQGVMFLIYQIAYFSIQTYAATDKIDSTVNVAHFIIAIFSPTGSLSRALYVALNLLYIDCKDSKFKSYPGDITVYGGPVLYLILQTLFLFGILIWWDNGPKWRPFRHSAKPTDIEEKEMQEKEISDELSRVHSMNDGLRVHHISKKFRSNVAVQDINFGVSKGEIFALLGPNGAGKSTTISMIRGELQPSNRDGEIMVEDYSIQRQKAAARLQMGVCPQFDAIDQLTVIEHLSFYARVRGVADVNHNVEEVVRAVGLQSFVTRLAAKLSGGNKRKLSLAIALLGNPSVLLLDEPSSGMDAASKRVMWKTLASIVPNRSILLTTHSMEEADALAHRAGIMATKMLALGTTDYLRKKHGDAYYVHLISRTAPATSTEEMDQIRSWVATNFADAEIESKTYHGQLRFSVPARSSTSTVVPQELEPPVVDVAKDDTIHHHHHRRHDEHDNGIIRANQNQSSVSTLLNLLERNKDVLGLEYYSISQTTLDQVFLTIIGKHNVEEEHLTSTNRNKEKRSRLMFWRRKG